MKSHVLWSSERLCKWECFLCGLTRRKYLMFLLWKSPGGSNRYRSSSHKSRRKPDKHTHTHTFQASDGNLFVGIVLCDTSVYLLRPYMKCTPRLDKSSSPSPLQPQRKSPPAPLLCPLFRHHSSSVSSSPIVSKLSSFDFKKRYQIGSHPNCHYVLFCSSKKSPNSDEAQNCMNACAYFACPLCRQGDPGLF